MKPWKFVTIQSVIFEAVDVSEAVDCSMVPRRPRKRGGKSEIITGWHSIVLFCLPVSRPLMPRIGTSLNCLIIQASTLCRKIESFTGDNQSRGIGMCVLVENIKNNDVNILGSFRQHFFSFSSNAVS